MVSNDLSLIQPHYSLSPHAHKSHNKTLSPAFPHFASLHRSNQFQKTREKKMANEKTNMALHEGQVCFAIGELQNLTFVQTVLRAAIELRVFDIIADAGPEAQLSAAEIVSKIPTSNPKAAETLDRMLRSLSAYGFLINTSSRQSQDGAGCKRTYSLSKMSHSLLRNTDQAISVAAGLLVYSSRESFQSYYVLKDAVLEEDFQHFTEAYGVTPEEFRKTYLGQLFDESMTNLSKLVLDEVLKVYKGFEGVTELMDVGGGNGTTLQHILTAYPDIRGVNFDLPHVIDTALKIPGVEHVAGDMFVSLPKAKSILLKSILHNWDDEKCEKLLKNCWDALPNCGKLVTLEYIIPERIGNNSESRAATTVDMKMLTIFGGRERTLAEYEGLAKSAGFLGPKAFPTTQGFHVLEFFKTSIGQSMST